MKQAGIGAIALLMVLGMASCGSQGSSNASADGPAQSSSTTWRDPSLAVAMRTAHQHVVQEATVTVLAKAPWMQTGLRIARGEHLWADTRSDGRWSGNPQLFPYSDANGLPAYPGGYRVYAHAPVESLIGFVGDAPLTPPEVNIPVSTPAGGPGGITNPGFVKVGNALLNYVPMTTGAIWLRNNDNTNYYSDLGQQIARVIVTR
jgi:hypothetical protein